MAAQTNAYEFTYIINAVLSEDQIKAVVERVNKLIKENGGEIKDIDEWGSRRLAYPINKKRNGYYVNLYMNVPGEFIVKLERALEIDDDVLRYMALRMDAKMLRSYEERKSSAPAAAPAE